ncbi:MAG: ribosome maturation factor RimP [Methylophilaceae bacterium]|nr:ribosome maturation factor RimP [Methylophilaceae bacterium]
MQDLHTLVEQSVTQLGYELVDLEVSNRGKLLRVFIDKLNPADIKDSVNIDDCVLVSNQLGNILSVEHDVDYDRLEVSSPGIDRILKKEADFLRFIGERAQVKLRMPMAVANPVGANKEPRKSFLGLIRGLEDGWLLLECDGAVEKLALNNIDKAKLNPLF